MQKSEQNEGARICCVGDFELDTGHWKLRRSSEVTNQSDMHVEAVPRRSRFRNE